MTAKSEPAGLPPVSLPAGSYDHETLHAGFDKAAKGKPEDQEALATTAVDAARQGEPVSHDPALVAGHAFVDVETRFGTERQQVFVPPKDPEPLPEPVDDDAEMRALEARNVKTVKAQVAAAVKEGEVAPEPEPEAQVQAGAPAAAPGPAPADETK